MKFKMEKQEYKFLKQYASVTNSKILENQADLNPKDRATPEMLQWCREQKRIVVLQSGTILTSHPNSRLVQNCKIVMINKGLIPGQVYPASSNLIRILLENAEDFSEKKTIVASPVSSQQQRLRLLIKEALALEASDIHIEVRKNIARIRFRKHGELFLHAEWLPKLGREIASVAFNKETDHAVTHFNPLVPQNASMPLEIGQREVRLRLASLPAHQGFDVTMRILTADEKIEDLESLGYFPEQIKMLNKAVRMPYGAIIVAGPTGSGKTTTLASCMNLVNNQRKIFTIEDPVEKIITLATQVPVNTEHYDRSFASMTRAVLRMDPDVIVLGEVRDEDTANMMIRAAITGHLVFSTVHANTAPDIITRLTDFGLSSTLLASPNILVCLICQRLVPLLCSQCATSVSKSALHHKHLNRWKMVFGEDFHTLKARGGCHICHGRGIHKRTVIAEIIWVDEIGREHIKNVDVLSWRAYLKTNGWQPYQEHLLTLVKQGHCDPLDAESIIGEIHPQMKSKTFNYRDIE